MFFSDFQGDDGVPEDDVEAVKWYRMAAEQGYEAAKEWLERNAKENGEQGQGNNPLSPPSPPPKAASKPSRQKQIPSSSSPQ